MRGVHTAPANESEVSHLERAVDAAHITPTRLYADKGYASAANRQTLRQRNIKRAIMYKAQRNTPLTRRQQQANKLISRRCYIVEQCFGTAKRLFGMARANYFGAHKFNAQIILKGLCMNLLKAANNMFIEIPSGEQSVRKQHRSGNFPVKQPRCAFIAIKMQNLC